MEETIKNRGDARAWQKEYETTSPAIGSTAPDFELRDLNGENPVRLSSFRDQKPVALVFGSFT